MMLCVASSLCGATSPVHRRQLKHFYGPGKGGNLELVTELNQDSFKAAKAGTDGPWLIEFYAPCKFCLPSPALDAAAMPRHRLHVWV